MTADPLDERAQLAQAAFERHVRPQLTPADDGQYVAVDIDTGDFEIAPDDLTACERLLNRRPGARGWLMRAGQPTAYRIGRRAGL